MYMNIIFCSYAHKLGERKWLGVGLEEAAEVGQVRGREEAHLVSYRLGKDRDGGLEEVEEHAGGFSTHTQQDHMDFQDPTDTQLTVSVVRTLVTAHISPLDTHTCHTSRTRLTSTGNILLCTRL